MAPDALLLGTGARTSIGGSAAATAAAARAGIACFERHPFMIDRFGEPMVVAADPRLAPACAGTERLLELARSACLEALSTIAPGLAAAQGLAILVGLPEPRPGLPDDLVPRFVDGLRERLAPQWRPERIVAATKGHGAGLLALASAAAQAPAGGPGLVLAVGVDSWLDPLTLEWLDAGEQLHSENNAWGFVPGEAAGACLVGHRAAAAAAGIDRAPILRGVGIATEPHRIKTDTVCTGEGLSEAVALAIAGLDDPVLVDDLITDMNGEPYRAEELGYAIVRNAARLRDASGFTAPADCWGDVGAASGPLFAILAEAAARRGHARGPRTLCCASSEAGDRVALLIECTDPRGN